MKEDVYNQKESEDQEHHKKPFNHCHQTCLLAYLIVCTLENLNDTSRRIA